MNLLTIILAVALALGGLIGGIWFWQKMAESPIWEQWRKIVEIIGLGFASLLFALVVFLVCEMELQPPEILRKYFSYINIACCSIFSYLLGYDASILRPKPEEMKAPLGNEKSTLKFHFKLDLLKKALFAIIILIAPEVGLLLLSRISIYVFGMWVVGVVGFAMGFLVWEHLRETGSLTGTFKRWVVVLSLLTTVAIGCIAGYGVYVDSSAGNPESIQIFLVTFMLLIWGLAWYMLALCVVAFRAK